MGKYTDREYQLGEWYLAQRGESPAWYRCRYNKQKRRTERVSIGTNSLEEAKQRLNEWFSEQFQLSRANASPKSVEFAEVALDYWNGQGKHLRSAATVQILLRYWNEWWGEGATLDDIRDIMRQETFQAHLLHERCLSINSTNRVLEIGRAAINRAWKRGAIASAPFISTLPPDNTKPKGRPLEPKEIQKLYEHSADHLRIYIRLAIATAARPEALCQLTWQQIDLGRGIIHLNPEGRKQTSKRRPSVRIPPALNLEGGEGNVIMFRGNPLGKITQAWRKAVVRAGMDIEVKPYSLRHTAARWMRMHNVPMEQIAQQLGHKIEGYNMTERYAAWSPDYLQEAMNALNLLLMQSVPLVAEKVRNGR